MKVAVVTPSIGNRHLIDCVSSVEAQTYKDLTHYIFIDGYDYRTKVFDTCESATKTKFVVLEENIGKGWYGHRVYAACSFLVNADVIIYLDEDNFIAPNHVETMVSKIKEGYDWAYSLRKIVSPEGEFICEDNCESLGEWPVYFNDQVFHIDSSCFAIRRDIAVKIGHAWYGQWGADRQFFHALKGHFKNFAGTGKHTVQYRLDGNPNSVTKEFFDKGNEVSKQKYGDNFPWTSGKKLNKIEIGPGISIVE